MRVASGTLFPSATRNVRRDSAVFALLAAGGAAKRPCPLLPGECDRGYLDGSRLSRSAASQQSKQQRTLMRILRTKRHTMVRTHRANRTKTAPQAIPAASAAAPCLSTVVVGGHASSAASERELMCSEGMSGGMGESGWRHNSATPAVQIFAQEPVRETAGVSARCEDQSPAISKIAPGNHLWNLPANLASTLYSRTIGIAASPAPRGRALARAAAIAAYPRAYRLAPVGRRPAPRRRPAYPPSAYRDPAPAGTVGWAPVRAPAPPRGPRAASRAA